MLKNTIVLSNSKSRVAEAFRTLRTNIQFSSLDNDIKSMVVTSAAPCEGKSTIAINLAITLAQAGKKVVLLDCDLRKPVVHKKLGVTNEKGITNVLIGSAKLDDCIAESEISNLHVLTAGDVPPNPSELLGSKKMKSLLEELEGLFDVVIIDSPPVIAVTDAQIISAISKGTILVAAYGQTEKSAILKAKELLVQVNAHILGVVINKVIENNQSRKYGKYYKKYYGSYYEKNNQKKIPVEV